MRKRPTRTHALVSVWSAAALFAAGAVPSACADTGSTRDSGPRAHAAPGRDGANAAFDLGPLPPHHGASDLIVFGGQGAIRLADDRTRGVSEPEWFTVDRFGGFVHARLGPALRLSSEGSWDRAADQFVLERAELGLALRSNLELHGGVFLAPLGRTNLRHDAPWSDFDNLSYVATRLVGVPHAQIGIGLRGGSRRRAGSALSYEVDLVTGYDSGVILESPGGARLPSGRNNYGDDNGMPAAVARIALHGASDSEAGLAVQSGQYNVTKVGGVRVDRARYLHVFVADAATTVVGLRISAESGLAIIDVPPGLGGLYAGRQWAGSIEAARLLREPILASWRGSALALAARADAIDFDPAVDGDSRSRVSVSLNVRQRPRAVTRFGWYYEVARDRFNNDTPMAGFTLSVASYF